VLTHYSGRHRDAEPFAVEASAIFPDVVAAVDFDVVPIERRRGTFAPS
jgi:ribonuclease BN (tRNA processing enzyme)